MTEYMRVDGFSAPELGKAVPEGKRVVYFIHGPDGFTERLGAPVVLTMCRLGLIKLDQEDEPDNGDKLHYKTFKATGRHSMM